MPLIISGEKVLLQPPMHIVDEYHSNDPFYPVPQLISQSKSSKQFYNWTIDKDEVWFSGDSKLGSEFAIYKVDAPLAAVRSCHVTALI